MPKCIIDGKEVEWKPGENLIEVARRAAIQIPYFCYHPGLSVVAQCRMCAVEIEKMPKLQTACSTPPTEGMVVKTTSDRVKGNQKAIMEFLLMNHPLDCPICDKSGECDLQDFSFGYGSPLMRSEEERRTYIDLDMGPVIQKNMNRCIHCSRCIRFGDEIAGIHEMVAVERGNNVEITTIDGLPLQTEYAGNYADICPTGSLTLRDFRFEKRVWYLKKTPTICEGCSRGCNMEIHHEKNTIHRCIPRTNLDINKYWLCDEGRFNYHYTQKEDRILDPLMQTAGVEERLDWSSAIRKVKSDLDGKKLAVLVGSDLTQEEAMLVLEFIPTQFKGVKIFHYGTPQVFSSIDDAPADAILKRKSKTANLHGIEKLGVPGFKELPEGTQAVLVFRGGRAVLPELKNVLQIGVGVFHTSQTQSFAMILPGPSFVEKDGTIFNFEGREQKFKRALFPLGQSKALSEVFMMWSNLGVATPSLTTPGLEKGAA